MPARRKKAIAPDEDQSRLVMGVEPLTVARLREIQDQVGRAQVYGKQVALPPDDVLALIAEARLRRRYAARAGRSPVEASKPAGHRS